MTTQTKTKRMSKAEKEAFAAETLINAMMKIAGYNLTAHDLAEEAKTVKGKEWYQKYTMTREQEKEWMEWGTDYLRKFLKHSSRQAHLNMQMMNLAYGLRIHPRPEQEQD